MKYYQLKSKADSTFQSLLDREKAFQLKLETRTYDQPIETQLNVLKKGIDELEEELSKMETTAR